MLEKANANPAKSFFVSMLTRDISLTDCVFDLIDNSVDAAWRSSGKNSGEYDSDTALTGYAIDIRIDKDMFEITDNCGGITLDDAKNYAFNFGRSKSKKPADGNVGVYGIGMKRAIFKIGQKISVRSSSLKGSIEDNFEIPIDVSNWLADDSTIWDFDIIEDSGLQDRGLKITVSDLSEETKVEFGDPTYSRVLAKTVGREYMIPLLRGLSITINGIGVQRQDLTFVSNAHFNPMRESFTIGKIQVTLIAGMQAHPPDELDADNDARRADDRSGWYVACNGRIVVTADKTSLTGWGLNGVPKWHSQYQGLPALFC